MDHQPPERPATVSAGNYISGGNFYGQVAGTQSGSITQNQGGAVDQELIRRLEPLLRRLAAEASELGEEQAEALIDDIGTVRKEAASAEPDRKRVRVALTRITQAAGAVAPMLEIVQQVKDVIAPLLH